MITITIPCLNEEENIRPLYEELINVLKALDKDYEIIFVDDGSSDKSLNEMKKLKKQDPKIKIIKFRKNFGQSAALNAGFKQAKGKIVISMDCDLQNDPKDIPRLLEKLNQGFDCVSGWRKERKDPLTKKISSKCAARMRKFFLGTNLHDFGCTLKAYKKECLKDLDLHGEMHRYIPPLLSWKGYKTTEIQVNHRKRIKGKTKYSWKRLGKGFIDMINVWFWKKYSQRPLHIFGGFGMASFIIGFLSGRYSIYLKIFRSTDLSSTFLPVFSVFMVMIGIQFFISGLLADISIKNYHEKRKDSYNIEKIID